MGLTQKILLFTSAIVVALVAISLSFTTVQADRLAKANINRGLVETKGIWETFQADRFSKLKLGLRALGNEPVFKAAIQQFADEGGETALGTVRDMFQERSRDIAADFVLATDASGRVIARSDRPGAQGEDLSKDPIVMKPLGGEESTTVWRQGDQLYHAVSVPMAFGSNVVGVLVAGYGLNEALASQIQKLTHSQIAFLTTTAGQPPQIAVSSLGARENAFRSALTRPELAKPTDAPFSVSLDGDDYIGIEVPLKAAGGEAVGAVVALRSLFEETASFRQFRNSLVFVSLVVMALALGLAYAAATRITRPVRTLVSLVERAREGSFSGAVSVATQDEIGSLARAFNALLADLREKDQMITFLREGMTLLRKHGPSSSTLAGPEATTALEAITPTRGVKIEMGTLFAGRYEILGAVGKGGMGVVFRARDQQLDEVVALKVLRGEMLSEDPTMLERFKQEIKLARRITNRNVLRTHDFGESDGTFYISMEFLEGVTLKDLIRSKGPMPLGVGLSIAKQMCHGLEAAHEQGVVHRDIKPQNMLILVESAELKIMDFGIARRSEVEAGAPGSGLTTAGMVMGTPDYMPPEQAQGEAADFRSDIYSLGVVLFETFTGQLPFTGDTIMKIVMAHIQTPPPRPRSVNPRVPADLEAVILKCLEKEPAKRYQKVGELLEALTSISSRSGEAAA
jgi:HAMP domain-containing protein/predicted Ser/Thr protein kinase